LHPLVTEVVNVKMPFCLKSTKPMISFYCLLILCVIGLSTGALAPMTPSLRKDHHHSVLLMSDLDGTLIGDESNLQNFNSVWESRERSVGSVLCYNTARSIRDCNPLFQTKATREMNENIGRGTNSLHGGGAPNLIVPDVLITAEGTEIRYCVDYDNAEFQVDEDWERQIREQWWESGLAEKVEEICDPYDEGLIPSLNDIENSPPRGEARYAITVSTEEKAQMVVQELQDKLAENCTIYSMAAWGSDPPPRLICVLPALANKANAAMFLRKKLGYESHRCIAAGDTLNDAPLLQTEIPFICVANADQDLLKVAHKLEKPDLHFRASLPMAGGVLEGLSHFTNKLRGSALAAATEVAVSC